MMTMKREPKLRFPEFSGEWEEKRIKDILKIRHGKDQKKVECLDGAYPILGTGGALGRTNSFLYNKESVLIGRKGTIDKPMYISTPFWTVDTLFYSEINEQYSVKFIYYMFNTITWKKYSEASGVPSLSASTIESINVNLSSLPEQQKIADCLTAMDESIESQQQKVEQLKAYKKGLLQQIFSQSLRFPGFEGEWEEKRLGDKGSFKKGNLLSKKDLTSEGVPCILYGELYTSYNEVAKTIISKTNLVNQNLAYANNNDVLMPASSTTDDVVSATCLQVNNVAIGGDVNIFTPKTAEDGRFISYGVNGFYKRRISALAQGSTIFHLYGDQLKKVKMKFPSFHEQQKIADCLSTLDEVIELENQKLEQLRQYKKGLLQQLFV